jgi:hypothetical protein
LIASLRSGQVPRALAMELCSLHKHLQARRVNESQETPRIVPDEETLTTHACAREVGTKNRVAQEYKEIDK